jgi:hypothetical protein
LRVDEQGNKRNLKIYGAVNFIGSENSLADDVKVSIKRFNIPFFCTVEQMLSDLNNENAARRSTNCMR